MEHMWIWKWSEKLQSRLIKISYIKGTRWQSTNLSKRNAICFPHISKRMKDTTTSTYKQTRLWALSVQEIEQGVFDNVVLVRWYISRAKDQLDISVDTLQSLHALVCGNYFSDGWVFRQHNVQVGDFDPIDYTQVWVEMKKLDDDLEILFSESDSDEQIKKKVAEVMWRILRVHPFFDYNARAARLFAELCLLKHGLSILWFRWATREAFAKAMKKATFERDFTLLYELM